MSAFGGKQTWRDVGHATAGELGRCLSLFAGTARLCNLQRCRVILTQHHRTDRLMGDFKWIRDLKPDEARAAIESLDARKGPFTVREVLESRRLRRALAGEGYWPSLRENLQLILSKMSEATSQQSGVLPAAYRNQGQLAL
jgi:hypothetical protein